MGVIKQVYREDTKKKLDIAYRKGSSITGLMDDKGLGKQYAVDFLEYIDEEIPTFKGKRVLEIGCGTGYLLSELKKKGAEVEGIEPGINAVIGSKKFDIPIINDFLKCHILIDYLM